MKRFLWIFVAAIVAACSGDKTEDAPAGPEWEGVRIAFAGSNGAVSRTDLDNLNVVWKAGDALGVFSPQITDASNYKTAVLNADAGSRIATFNTRLEYASAEQHTFYVYYPYAEQIGLSNTSTQVSLQLSNMQDGEISKNAFMWATATVTPSEDVIPMTFTHAFAYLDFQVSTASKYTGATLRYLTITAADDKVLAGTYKADLTSGKVTFTDKKSSITVTPTISPLASAAQSVFAVINPEALAGTDVTIDVELDMNGKVVQLTSTQTGKDFAPQTRVEVALDLDNMTTVSRGEITLAPTTATVEWSDIDHVGKTYTIELYSDAVYSTLLRSHTTTLSTTTAYVTYPPRFTFGYLTPSTTYYVKVKNESGSVIKETSIATSAAHKPATDEMFYMGFDNVYWGGDFMNLANGTVLTSTTLTPATIAETISSLSTSATSARPTTDGGGLSSYSDTMRSLMGFDGWTTTSCYARPGFVKIGTKIAKGDLRLPQMQNLLQDTNTISVSFLACPFTEDVANVAADYCYLNLLDASGVVKVSRKIELGAMPEMPVWTSYNETFTNVENGDRLQFLGARDEHARVCLDDITVRCSTFIPEGIVAGYVRDSSGNAVADVVVSDGFQCVTTDSKGYYAMTPDKDTYYIYYSIPSDCEVQVDANGSPAFYTRYNAAQQRYDFTVTKLAGGAETKFNLFCLADPQCASTAHANRFANETVPDVKKNVDASSLPCYGVTLGDIAYSEGTRNTVLIMPTMRSHMSKTKTGLPIFQTIGNHDFWSSTSTPMNPEEGSSTMHLKYQRYFESYFGPVNYSWNRGNVHIVSMRNIMFSSATEFGTYSSGFTAEQYEWLKEDLSHVSTDKMVILCVHIPLLNSSNSNIQNVLALLRKYRSPQVMAGHTHYMRMEPTKTSGIFERVHAAVCGAWWYSNLNGDGCPNGYAVYTIDGTVITDGYYKGVNTGMNERSNQIRLYRGNMNVGGQYEYFRFPYASNILLANVFNGSSKWIVKVYENGTYSGTMTMISNKKNEPARSSTNSATNPTIGDAASSLDWWAIGYNVGVIGRGNVSGNRSSYITNGFHLWKYALKNSTATIRVEATDEFGNTYTQDKVMSDYEYTNCGPGNN